MKTANAQAILHFSAGSPKHSLFADIKDLGGTLIFSYLRRLGPFWGIQKFEFQYLFFFSRGGGGGGVRKMNIFGDMKILWIFFGGHHKI